VDNFRFIFGSVCYNDNVLREKLKIAMLTKKQKEILDFIKNYSKKNDYSPSLEEIAKHFKRAVGTIHEHVQNLKEGGYLWKEENQPRGIELIKNKKNSDLIKIPLLGTIAAGQPIEAVENKETITVPRSQISKSGEHFALRVQGDSMVDEGIFDSDIVVIRKQPTAENGETIVALLNDNKVTLKKIYREKNGFRLQPANPALKPIFVKELEVQGKVISVIRNFKSIPVFNTVKSLSQYKKLPINKIILGDALEELKKFPDKSIDLILTDPPYGLNKIGIKNDYDLSVFYSSLNDSYRILKDNSFYITFFSTKFLPKLFINNPFNYFWNFVLYCPNGRVSSPIGYSKYMSCTVFKKGEPKIVKRNKDIFVDTPGRMIEPDEGFIDHPTPKPKTFIAGILKMFSKEGNIVLDPFMGSGSTAMACKLAKREYIGIELDEKYYKLAEKRLKNFRQNLNLLSN